MNNKQDVLKIFCLSQPLASSEWASLLGDKYSNSLPFSIQLMNNYQDAQVIIWDGTITPKSAELMEEVIKLLKTNRVLLLVGMARTLFRGHPFVKFVETSQMRVVELPAWSILPEELLLSLHSCWEKFKHV